MTDAAWKAFERRVALLFGGKRRGAHTSDGVNGKSDVIVDGWSVECKLLSRIGYQDLLNAALQAESNRESGNEIPVAVIKRKGDRFDDTLIVMRVGAFTDFFLGR